MSTRSRLSPLVRLSDRLYRILLVTYPAPFRQAYGTGMAQAFRDSCREAASRRGVPGLLALWLPTLADLAATALAERLSEEIPMLRVHLIRSSGIAAILGAGLWLVGVNLSFNPPFDIMIPACLVLFLFGLLGFTLQLGRRGGWIARTGAAVGLVALAVFAISMFGTLRGDLRNSLLGELARAAVLWSPVALSASLILIGVATLRAHSLPRLNAAPLLIGVPIGGIAAVNAIPGVLVYLDNTPTIGQPLAHTTLLFFGLGWGLLGYALWTVKGEAQTSAQPASAA